MTKISVVMPVYNVEKFVGRSIETVLAQSFTDFELILVDDGATDGSLEICRSYTDPRIRIVRQANRGLAGARNTGIRHCNGEYVALLDSDDLWHPDKLLRHIQHLDRSPLVGISYSGSAMIDADDVPIGISMTPKLTDITKEQILCRNPIGNGSAPVFRRRVFDNIAFKVDRGDYSEVCYFDESFRYGEDIECWMRIACKTHWRFEGIAGDLTLYRIVTGGLSANTEKMYEFWNRMLAKVSEYDPALARSHGGLARAYQLRYYARRAVREKNGTAALGYFIRAMRSSLRLIVEEPQKTLVTGVAALAVWLLPRTVFRGVEHVVRARA